MTDHSITADARKVSGADFSRSLGLRIRTKEEKAAEWEAECERYADMIEAGNEWAVPPPYLWDARKIVAGRSAIPEDEVCLTTCRSDPFEYFAWAKEGAPAAPSGSHPTDQAPAGLGAARIDPSRKRRAA